MISGHLTGWVQANNSLFCCLLFRESLYLHLQYMFSPFTWTCISQSWNFPRMVFWSWGNFPRFSVHRPMFLFNNINLFKNNFSSSLPSHCVCNFKFPVLFSSQNCTSFIPFCFGLSISISINTETSYRATECLLCCLAIFSDKLLAYCDFNLIYKIGHGQDATIFFAWM